MWAEKKKQIFCEEKILGLKTLWSQKNLGKKK